MPHNAESGDDDESFVYGVRPDPPRFDELIRRIRSLQQRIAV